MKRKKEYNYFEVIADLSKYSLECAIILHETLINFDQSKISHRVKEMHKIEHDADIAKHEIMNHLVKEFLPPIEREDITGLTQHIDNVTDAVEDVIIYIDIFNIQSIPPEILKFSELIVSCCQALDSALEEFKHFKSSKTIREKIIEINNFEAEGDNLYVDLIRTLYRENTDPVQLMCWTEIIHRFERCCDKCEDVSDLLETIVMKNS
jgi:predicted phosphate transport protein (TIGR00153 family)